MHRLAVHQPGPQALVELGDELRQVLHILAEVLDLSAMAHNLTDLLDDLTQKNRMRMHTFMHSHPIFCPNLSTKEPNQVFFQSCLMNTCPIPGGFSRQRILSLFAEIRDDVARADVGAVAALDALGAVTLGQIDRVDDRDAELQSCTAVDRVGALFSLESKNRFSFRARSKREMGLDMHRSSSANR